MTFPGSGVSQRFVFMQQISLATAVLTGWGRSWGWGHCCSRAGGQAGCGAGRTGLCRHGSDSPLSPQTIQPGHHHQNLLGRKVGSTPTLPCKRAASARRALTCASSSFRAETERGLSRKHIIEGRERAGRGATGSGWPRRARRAATAPDGPCAVRPGLKASLERLQLDYVDVVFANRPDPNTPMEGRCRRRRRAIRVPGRAGREQASSPGPRGRAPSSAPPPRCPQVPLLPSRPSAVRRGGDRWSQAGGLPPGSLSCASHRASCISLPSVGFNHALCGRLSLLKRVFHY